MNRNIFAGLLEIVKDRVKQREVLSGYTSFHIGGPARYFVEVNDLKELERTVKFLKEKKTDYFVLGCGTNVLFSDRGLKGVVIKLGGEFSNFSIAGRILTCGAAVKLPVLLKAAVERKLTGLEFSCGIPGSMGGAIVSNAGTVLGTIKDVLSEVKVMSKTGKIKSVTAEDLKLSYRHSEIENNDIITGARLVLKESDTDEICKKIEAVKRKRGLQPSEWNNAGSVFKNPAAGVSAGELIDRAGFKGFNVNGACVSEKHANFIINKLSASSKDVSRLISLIKKKVKKESGAELKEEIKVINYNGRCLT